MRSFSFASLVLVGLASSAAAEPHMHDGFYFGVTGGLGYYSSSADMGGFSGFTLPSSSLMLAGTIIPGLAVGGGFVVDYSSGATVDQGGQEVDFPGAQMVVALGAFADYYLDPRKGGLHFQGFVGWGGLEETEGAGGSDPTGLTMFAGAGYDMFISDNISVGGLGRIMYGSHSLGNMSFTTIAPAVLGTLTLH
jgi:hypothetical protein